MSEEEVNNYKEECMKRYKYNMQYKNYNEEKLIDEMYEKDEELKRLNEDIKYSDYCNEELRKKITNLEYKITTYEDYKSRIDKAIEYINTINESFEKINDKVLLSNRAVDILVIDKLYKILKGEDNIDIKTEKESEYLEEYLIQKRIEENE